MPCSGMLMPVRRMRIKIILLTGMALAWGIGTQAQQSGADTTLRDYHIRYYHLPGLPDDLSAKHIDDSAGLTPPIRQHYQDLRQFKKDSTDFLQFKHIRDSLGHRIDSLRAMSAPVFVCSIRPAAFQPWVCCSSKEAILSRHIFSAMACSLRTRSIRMASSSVVIS